MLETSALWLSSWTLILKSALKINVYLPTNKNDSEYRYRECLDVLHDIIRRYEPTHKILLCGDLNGTLLPTRNNKHDVILKDFVQEHFLSTGLHYSGEPTFFHFNGVVTSQIDYILSNDPDLYISYSILQKDPRNISSHVSVQVKIRLPVKVSSNTDSSVSKSKQNQRQFTHGIRLTQIVSLVIYNQT